jgi:hypothetical protein
MKHSGAAGAAWGGEMGMMNGLFEMRTPEDLLGKLEADFQRLTAAEPLSKEAQYAAFDFFLTANHLPDWLVAAKGGSKTAWRNYADEPLVGAIANGGKHFTVNDPRYQTASDGAIHEGAFDSNVFDRSAFDVDGLEIENIDGSIVDVIDLAERVLEHWRRELR